MGALSLHKYLRKSAYRSVYCPAGLVDYEDSCGNVVEGTWRQSAPTASMLLLQKRTVGHNSCNNSKEIRDTFKEYFCNTGALPWQWNKYL